MNGHLSKAEIEKFHNRAGNTAEMSAAAGHLGECSACREVYRELVAGRRGGVSFTLGAGAGFSEEHLDYEAKVYYADQGMEGEELNWMKAHLEVCAGCREDLAAFLADRTRRDAELEVRYLPPVERRLPGRPLVRRLTEPGKWRAAAMIAAACGAATLLAMLMLGLWRNDDPSAPEMSQSAASGPGTTGAAGSPSPTATEAGLLAFNKAAGAGQDGLTEAERSLIEAARRGQLRQPEALKGFEGGRGAMRGNGRNAAANGLLAPRLEVVADERPLFRWRAAAGATGYRVYVMDTEGRTIAVSPQLGAEAVEWRAEAALEGGREYLWALGTERGGAEIVAPAPGRGEARFRLRGAEERAKVEEWSRRVSSPFARGVLYARSGMISEAEREWRRAAADKTHTREARRLLNLVRSWR